MSDFELPILDNFTSKYPQQASQLLCCSTVSIDNAEDSYPNLIANTKCAKEREILISSLNAISVLRFAQLVPSLVLLEQAASRCVKESQIQLMVNIICCVSKELQSLLNFGEIVKNVQQIVSGENKTYCNEENPVESYLADLGRSTQTYSLLINGLLLKIVLSNKDSVCPCEKKKERKSKK
jgi:hypothetical protein